MNFKIMMAPTIPIIRSITCHPSIKFPPAICNRLCCALSGKENPDSGGVTWAPGVRLGYLPQEPDDLQQRLTLLEYYRLGLTGYDEDFIFGLVTCGLFNYDEQNKTLGQVSIGQLRKLETADNAPTTPTTFQT